MNDGNICGFGFGSEATGEKNDEVSERQLCEKSQKSQAAPTSGLSGPMRISVHK